MFKIQDVNPNIIVSQRAVVERLEQLQTKYLDTIQNIEFYPVIIARLEAERENATDQKLQDIITLIKENEMKIKTAKQDLQYFEDKIMSLQTLLSEEAKQCLALKLFNSSL